MEIRFLTADDASAYRDIRLEALEREPEAFGSSPEEHHKLTLAEIATRLFPDPSNNFVVGAFAGGRLVATAGFYGVKGIKERHKGHIWGSLLAREQRGKGTAREMLRMLLERAAAIEGMEQITLAVGSNQSAAAKLYRSLGFKAFGCEHHALKIGEKYIDEEHMVLFVKAPDVAL
ncbi:MAG TPA: GNAT family N-acetyltransferase [Candidatus Sulfotelmatobacter sp.]